MKSRNYIAGMAQLLRHATQVILRAGQASVLLVAVGLLGVPWQGVLAEGSAQAGLDQPLYEYGTTHSLIIPMNRPLYVDIASAGQVINISLCGNSNSDELRVELRNPLGAIVLNQTLSTSTSGVGRVSCTNSFTLPLTNPLKYVTVTSGAYEVRLYNNNSDVFRRFDITVTPDTATLPDPTVAAGRLWSYSWAYNAGSYAESASTDADYFSLTPGGEPGTNFIWELDLNNFAGYIYEIVANSIGVDSPNSGLSVPTSGNNLSADYPVYLGYPVVAGPLPGLVPTVNNFYFVDDQGVDSGISPGVTTGIQDSGTFYFDTNGIANYAIIIDSDQDGIYGAGDVLLLGPAVAGTNAVVWDGRDNSGNILAVGNYSARIQVRTGEYHFVASDAETSGGNEQGLTIYQALPGGGTLNTLVFWDDETILGGTTTLPNGQLAGRHSWGNFSGSGFGNERYIDTYVYGGIATTTDSSVSITTDDTPLAPDLQVTKTDNFDPVGISTPLSYTILVENLGSEDAPDVVVTDNLPVTLDFNSVSASQGSCSGTSTITCSLGTLAAGGNATITLNVIPNSSGNIENTATATTTGNDPLPANNQDTETTTVLLDPPPPSGPYASIEKSVDPASGTAVIPGDTLSYTVTVTNSGDSILTGVSLDDALPPGTSYVASSSLVTAPELLPETVRDEFTAISFSGNNGSKNWNNNWQELGESNGPGSGRVRVVSNSRCASGNCLRIGNGNISNRGVSRQVDLGNAVMATLTYSYRRRSNGGSASVSAQVYDDSTSTWVNLATYTLNSSDGTHISQSFDISSYMSANSQVRFIGSGSASGDRIFVDNIQVAYQESGSPVSLVGGAPPTLASGYTLAKGSQMIVTFQVTVDSPASVSQVDNAATVDSDQTSPNTSNTVSNTVFTGSQVTGRVWLDTNHDGIPDAGESGIGAITMVLHATGAGTCQSVQTNASGDYAFSGVADGDYQIIEAATETVPAPAICPPAEQDPAGHLSTTANTLSITVSGTDYVNQDFGDFHGSRFEGTVFEDNGTGGGTAHDGIINGNEAGLPGVAVEGKNGAMLDSTVTDANGLFVLWVADSASGATVDILAGTPGSFISVSKSDGGAGDSSAPASLDQISVNPVSGQVYSGLAFGDAREPGFAPNHSRSASPGSILDYPHTFTAYTTGTVSFSAPGLVATPNVPGWNAVLYDDSNCNSTLEQGEPVHAVALSMDADTTSQGCLIVRVFVPASAPQNAQYLITLAATFNYDATSLSTIRNRTDLTTVGDTSLALVKVVDKPTAQPGELLTYTITYINTGSDPLSDIIIDDKTPAFTTFSSAGCIVPLPANLTACSASTQPAIGATGPIQWTFNPGDTLQSGASGQVQYQVNVDN